MNATRAVIVAFLVVTHGACTLTDAAFGRVCEVDDDCRGDPADDDLVCRRGRCLSPEVVEVVSTGETCADAIPLGVPSTVQGSTVGATDDHAGVCAGTDTPDRAYVVTLQARSNLVVRLDVEGFDGSLYAATDPACLTLSTTACTDDPNENENTEVMRLIGVGPGDIYIIVDGANGVFGNGAGGGYTLDVAFEAAGCDAGFAAVNNRCVGIVGEVDAVVPRTNAAAVVLNDGRVLLTGGRTGPDLTATDSAEIYDPTTNAFTETAAMAVARARHSIVKQDTGEVIVMGGVDDAGDATDSVEIFDPVTETWSPGPPLPRARDLFTATVLPGGRIVVAGGRDGATTLGDVWTIDRTLSEWVELGEPLAQPRFGHVAIPWDETTIYFVGGRFGPDSQALEDVEFFENTSMEPAPPLDGGRGGAAGVLLEDDSLFITGGFDGSLAEVGARVSSATYQHEGAGWVDTANNASTARLFATATLVPGLGVVVAGGDLDGALGAVDLYLEQTRTFTPLPALRHPRLAHTAVRLRDGRVLIMGGDGGDANRTVPLAAAELIGVAP
jgi:hypothetical protein